MAKEISTYTHDGMELPFEDWSNTLHSFGDLTSIIQTTHDAALSSAVKAINRMQTMRNWLIGYYIVEYEQNGKDRAEYGAKLLKKLEERVNRKGMTTTLFKGQESSIDSIHKCRIIYLLIFFELYLMILENKKVRQ